MSITQVQVRAIVEVSDELDLQSFIDTANLIVTEDLAGKDLSEARLEQIQIYLAAHYTAIRDERGGLKSTKTLNAEDEYFGDYGKGLKATRYGQQAIVLDTSGSLSAIAEPVAKAEFRIV